MTFTIKIRTLPGSPMLCDYECPDCGCRFEQLVERDEHGDPPTSVRCDPEFDDVDQDDDEMCGGVAALLLSSPHVKFWSRDPVAVGRASKSDERDPRALDTEPLATGKMSKPEWTKYQRGISQERRYQKRLKSGRISKRVQVGGG